MEPAVDATPVERYLRDLQNRLCAALEQAEAGARFRHDPWQRVDGGDTVSRATASVGAGAAAPASHRAVGNAEPRLAGGGGGESRILEDGKVLERAGVNFSLIQGKSLPPAASARRPELAGRAFRAMGVSVVIHPRNPYAPTSHCNVRFLLAEQPGAAPLWWFGGGFDLTPYYGFAEDAQHWHETARSACLPFGADLYRRCKQNCDEYFYLPHRQEARGIGGLFFDDLDALAGGARDFAGCFDFTRSIGDHFLPAYLPILERRKNTPHGERERNWQLYRRGRYVEFNLVQDRGTLFGLQSAGRTESILMSLPPLAAWRYDYRPEPGSKEAELAEDFLKPRDWL